LPHAHSLGDFGLGESQPDTLLRQRASADPGDKSSRTGVDLIGAARKELFQE
jgi:hypothetical protein